MISVKFSKNGNKLNISMPLESPRLSATGKTELIATSGGMVRTDLIHDGRRVHVLCNAFVFPKGSKPIKKGRKTKGSGDGESSEE